MGSKKLFATLVCILFLGQSSHLLAQSLASIEKRADQAFSAQNYKLALPDYRQLLAKEQQNPKYNFCYGVCVYEVEQHFEAAKFFDVAIGLQQIPDPLLYFYRGRIFQEQFFFKEIGCFALKNKYRLCLNRMMVFPVHLLQMKFAQSLNS